jgi:hypothetical protein
MGTKVGWTDEFLDNADKVSVFLEEATNTTPDEIKNSN